MPTTVVTATDSQDAAKIPSPGDINALHKKKQRIGGLQTIRRLMSHCHLAREDDTIRPADFFETQAGLIAPFCTLIKNNLRKNLLSGVANVEFYVRYDKWVSLATYRTALLVELENMLIAYRQAGWYVVIMQKGVVELSLPLDVYNVLHGVASRSKERWQRHIRLEVHHEAVTREDCKYFCTADDILWSIYPPLSGVQRFSPIVQEATCSVCQAQPSEVLYNCGHCIVCESCDQNLHKCPVCRAAIQKRFQWKELQDQFKTKNHRNPEESVA